MNNRTLAWAAGILLLAVAFGAFGAHALKEKLSIEALLLWEKGVQYQFYHGLALLGLAAIHGRIAERTAGVVRILFVMGVVCFSGSLYMLAAREMLGIQGLTKVLGPITPLGGLLLMAGWCVLLIGALRKS